MIFNVKKTFCMCIKYKSTGNVRNPDVFLNGKILQWVSDHKYLGVYVNDLFMDDNDIKRQMKAIYGKGNTLIRKFKQCSVEVKTRLFQSFCTNMYCEELWNNYKVSSVNQLKVSYNNVFRHLLSVKGPCSITQLFLNNNVDSFKVLYRKSMFSLWTRVTKSENVLVQTIANSMYFLFSSKLFMSWRKEIFTV